MSKFEEATTEVSDRVSEVIRGKFPYLSGSNIEVVMTMKKSKSGGRYVLVKLSKATPIIKHMTATNINPNGVDYILYLDKKVFHDLSTDDQKRVIAHGLYHADVDFEKDNPYNVRQPEVQTFYDEIQDNNDDPRWAERLDLMAESLYDAEEESGS